jgi:hypothetical protein
MVIFGWRRTMKELATVFAQCRSCGMQGWQRIYRVISWFTLFFLPVLPLWVARKSFCNTCGRQWKLSKEEADALVAHAAQRA